MTTSAHNHYVGAHDWVGISRHSLANTHLDALSHSEFEGKVYNDGTGPTRGRSRAWRGARSPPSSTGSSPAACSRRLARLRTDEGTIKGPRPSPAVDAVEAVSANYAGDWPAWGHRKIAAMMRADGHQVSTSTVERALRRREMLLPRGFRADRKSWAVLRRQVFHDPPIERNRVWQTDFSEFETAPAGSGASAPSSTTPPSTASPPRSPRLRAAPTHVACLHAAVAEAERVLGFDDLRDDRGELELAEEDTGEIVDVVPAPIAVVPTTGHASAARLRRLPSPARTRCCATSAPASGARRRKGANRWSPNAICRINCASTTEVVERPCRSAATDSRCTATAPHRFGTSG
jgi:hypothetical protein